MEVCHTGDHQIFRLSKRNLIRAEVIEIWAGPGRFEDLQTPSRDPEYRRRIENDEKVEYYVVTLRMLFGRGILKTTSSLMRKWDLIKTLEM